MDLTTIDLGAEQFFRRTRVLSEGSTSTARLATDYK